MKTLILITTLISTIAFGAGGEGHDNAAKNDKARNNSALFPPKFANKSLSTVADAPELQGPAFMEHVEGTTVNLKWQAVEGVSQYHVQVATDPNFKWLKVDETLYSNTTMEVKELEKGKHYYWRVAGLKPENEPSYLKGPFTKSMFSTTDAK